MNTTTIAGAFLTAAITSVSVLTFILYRLKEEIDECKEGGNWAEDPSGIPIYRLKRYFTADSAGLVLYEIGKRIEYAIYLGSVAAVCAVFVLLYNNGVRPAFDFDIEITVLFVAGLLICLETVVIVTGIKYIAKELE